VTAAANWGDERLPERFWNKVIPEPTSGCWFWTAGPAFAILPKDGGQRVSHPRLYAYRTLRGVIGRRARLAPSCGLDECINPSHMKLRACDKRVKYQSRFRLKEYGLSELVFRQMLNQQRGRCAVCIDPISVEAKRGLNVDHDHDTGAVRGLLCQRCNTGLGQFRDRPDLLRAAAAYLVKHGKPEGA
jgi:hypothetical protein